MNRPALGDNPLTRQRDSVLRQTEPAEPPLPPADPLAPEAPLDAAGRAAENRMQFVLSPRHVQILDDFCYHVRRATRYKLTRSEVIRVLIEQLEHQALAVQQIRSLEDLRRQMQAR